MENHISFPSISLRPATRSEADTIKQIISAVNINPMGLDWQRFILAIDPSGKVIGCGQIKPHAGGLLELASIAVLPDWRHKGIAHKIIESLISKQPGRLYLTCRSGLESFYRQFGFQVVPFSEMPPYYRRISRLVTLFIRLSRQEDRLLVMRRN